MNPRPDPQASNNGKEKLPFNRKKPGVGPDSNGGPLLLMAGWGKEA